MAVHEAAQEVLADTSHCHPACIRPAACLCCKFYTGSIHLYFVLNMSAINKTPDSKVILTISVAFLAIGLWKHLNWCYYVSLAVGAIGVISDTLSAYIVLFWNKLSQVLGLIMPNVILAPVFYLLLFPVSLLARIFRKSDALHLKNNSESLYKERNTEYDQSHFENMW